MARAGLTAAIQKLAARRKTVFPSGIAAANLLGFTTQSARQGEVAASASSLPRKLVGGDTVIHTRRPEAWESLPETDAALLDFLRRGGRTIKVADSEPPRVRAILAATGEHLGKTSPALQRLRASLNPFSRFDFGLLTGLPHARSWQAKERRP